LTPLLRRPQGQQPTDGKSRISPVPGVPCTLVRIAVVIAIISV